MAKKNENTEAIKRLFEWKSDYLLHDPECEFDFQEIYLEDFFIYVFSRGTGDDVPFEERMSKEYVAWREKKKQLDEQRATASVHGQKFYGKIDYSDLPFFRYNPIAMEFTEKVNERTGRKEKPVTIITKDLSECLDRIKGHDFVISSPVTYIGRNRCAKNARYLYAFTVDLDGVGKQQLKDALYQMKNGRIPTANIIVNSGHGIHLYYLLKEPVSMFETNLIKLNQLKKDLTEVVWNGYTSTIKARQYQGVLQGFRLPGTKTKFGEIIRAFYNEDSELFSLADLNNFTRENLKLSLTDEDIAQLNGWYNPTGVKLAEAERRWPEWYLRRIVNKDPHRNHWNIKRDLYDWWLRRLRTDDKVTEGHRFYCIMCLAVYAAKCDIPFEELKADAYALIERMDALTEGEDNHFTKDDVDDALKAYNLSYCTFPKQTIQNLTALAMPVGNRRNGRDRATHVKMMNVIRDNIAYPNGGWRGNGRHKEDYTNSKVAWKVAIWRCNHPDSHNKSACAKNLNMSRPTVIKWWRGVDIFENIARHPLSEYSETINEDTVREAFNIFMQPDDIFKAAEKAIKAAEAECDPQEFHYQGEQTKEEFDKDLEKS